MHFRSCVCVFVNVCFIFFHLFQFHSISLSFTVFFVCSFRSTFFVCVSCVLPLGHFGGSYVLRTLVRGGFRHQTSTHCCKCWLRPYTILPRRAVVSPSKSHATASAIPCTDVRASAVSTTPGTRLMSPPPERWTINSGPKSRGTCTPFAADFPPCHYHKHTHTYILTTAFE